MRITFFASAMASSILALKVNHILPLGNALDELALAEIAAG